MHRYQPRLHIVESDDINSFNWETRQTFIFPGTQFTTVTAYQNDKVFTQLMTNMKTELPLPPSPSLLTDHTTENPDKSICKGVPNSVFTVSFQKPSRHLHQVI